MIPDELPPELRPKGPQIDWETWIPPPQVKYRKRDWTDVEFALAFLSMLVFKGVITYFLLSLNNAYRPEPQVTHPVACANIPKTCLYNHTGCHFGATNVMLPSVYLQETKNLTFHKNVTVIPKYSNADKCRRPCKTGFMYLGFQTTCLRSTNFKDGYLEDCAKKGDKLLEVDKPYNIFTLTVLEVSLQQRFYFAKVLGSVFSIATVWGISLRYFPRLTLILTIVFETLGSLATGYFMYLQTGKMIVLWSFVGFTGCCLMVVFLLRHFLKTTALYLAYAKVCLGDNPEIIGWTFAMQWVALAYACGFVFIIKQSFGVLFPVNDDKQCILIPPFLVLMAWGYTGATYCWLAMFLRQLVRGMTAGAVALWYFHGTDTSLHLKSSEATVALGWCWTTSIGSYFLLSIILPVVEFIRLFQRRTGSMLLLRILMCGCGKPLATLTKKLDSHTIAIHMITGIDITRAAGVFTRLVNQKRLNAYIDLGKDTRHVFNTISSVAGFSVGVVVFVTLLFKYGVLADIKQTQDSIWKQSGFGFFAMFILIFAACFPKVNLLVCGFDSAINYGKTSGPPAMFIVSLCAASLTTVLSDFLSSVLIDCLEAMFVCYAIEKNDPDVEEANEEGILYEDVLELSKTRHGLREIINDTLERRKQSKNKASEAKVNIEIEAPNVPQEPEQPPTWANRSTKEEDPQDKSEKKKKKKKKKSERFPGTEAVTIEEEILPSPPPPKQEPQDVLPGTSSDP